MQASATNALPESDASSRAHSDRCRANILERIRSAGGAIGFAEFMHHALYAPGLGYYVAGNMRFGRDGDFVTAPEVSRLFGSVVARQVAPVIAGIDRADILEFGAGSGKLAADVLTRLDELGAVPERYRILEVSPDLVDRQKALLAERVPGLLDRIEWLPDLPAGHRGVVLANEVLDAMPAERFIRRRDGVRQVCVGLDDERFVLVERPAPAYLADAVATLEDELGSALPDGYASEIAPAARHWIRELGDSIDEGLVLLFDYGLPAREYYAADRSGGWLRCHFRHRAHDDPLILTGIQDITAWVDFTAIASAAVDAGLGIAGYSAQAEFLLGGGLAEDMTAGGPEEALALSREIKLLTLPGEMGEHFKVLGLTAGDIDTSGLFMLGDRTHKL